MKALLKWILVVPLATAAVAVLQLLPPLVFGLMSQVELKFTLLNLFLGVLLVTPILGFTVFWCTAVVMVPGMICRALTSKPQISITIVGTLFVPLQIRYLLQLWRSEEPRIAFAYHVLFLVLLLVGLVVNGAMAGEEQDKAARSVDIRLPNGGMGE